MEIIALAAAAAAVAVLTALSLRKHPVAPARPAASPLDQAERILAHRYANGRISVEEYDRITAVLRR